MSLPVLLVDDDRGFSAVAQAALARDGFEVSLARSLHEARKALEEKAPELVLLDRRLPDGDGLSFLSELKAQHPSTLVVMVTAHGDIQSAVEAVRAGAADYVAKPVELPELLLRLQRIMGESRLRERLTLAETELSSRRRLFPSQSPRMQKLLEVLDRVARTPKGSVLLLGPTGVGKEVLARRVHVLAHGEDAPFVHINCAALPETTMESELFGHDKGAFTDARTTRRGLVEVANDGTLFLDEVGELSLSLQAKLLTFLDSGKFRRLGGTQEQASTARIVAATNRSLEADIREGKFREDLWFRLSVFRIDVPTLAERPEDILPLARSLLDELCHEVGRKGITLSEKAYTRLRRYSFPGNVRELRNILERALVLEPGPSLDLELQPGFVPRASEEALSSSSFSVSGEPIPLEELEKRYVRYVLDKLGGRRMDAAKALGLSYPTFLKRLEEER